MNYFCDIDIGDIRVIVKKDECEDFKYSTRSREGAGFVCFLSGEGRFFYGGEVNKVSAGTFIRFDEGDSYSFDVPYPCSYITSNADILLKGRTVLPKVTDCTPEEISAVRRICRVWEEQGEYCYIEARILLLQLFMDMMKRISGECGDAGNCVSSALAYIHRHYNVNFSLEDISAACNISPSHLRLCFRRELGCSVMQYREELRMTRAKAMIDSGEFKLKEIAEHLGYYDIYHFSKKFKAATGSTPGRYREALK